MLSSPTVAAVSRRDRILIATSVFLVTALAWAYLIHLGRQTSAGVEYEKAMAAMGMSVHAAWSLSDAFFAFAMWTVMMAGMMAPAATPVLTLFAAAQAKRSHDRASLTILIFGLGYAAVWTGFSAGAALLQWILQQTSLLTAALTAGGPRLAGTILIAAGAYQLTPWKSRCLTHCRSPLGFLMTSWHDGNLGAFRMGLHHGVYCLGCCWALMGILFVVGVMNLVWVAALTAFVLIEKAGPAGGIIARVAGAAMILLGVFKLITPM